MAVHVIEATGLTKKYGDFTAVDHLDLRVRSGEVFGLLGPNGAGKTTTILMILGLTEPTAGQVRVLGMDPSRQPLSVKANVGYLPEEVGFYEELTTRENLSYIARLNGLSSDETRSRIDAALERVGLTGAAEQPVATLSHGMRQRLGVAEVLIKRPRLIILDEPTQGLDPERTREFLQIISGLKEEGITILLSSHQLHQVQAVCDRVGLFHQGRMVLEGAVSDLAQQVLGGGYRILVEAVGPEKQLAEALERLPNVVQIRRSNERSFELEARCDLRPEAAEAVIRAGGRLLALDVETASLDAVYARYFQEVEHDHA